MASVIVTCFLPVFFQKTFPAFKSQYAILNAAALTIFGFSSSIIGGIISDKFEKRSYMTKANIILIGNTIAIPLTFFAAFSGNFWVAMSLFAAKIFVSGSYLAPAITMMQNSTDPSNSGFVVSAYTFYAHIAQTISPIIFTYFATKMNAPGNPAVYAKLIFSAVCFGYGVSNIFYYRAGKAYTRLM